MSIDLSTEKFLANLRQRRDSAVARLDRWTLSQLEIQRAYKVGERNFYRANLDGANLDRANLDGANLDGANLDGASLIGARLIGARLIGARLIGARLDRAHLDGAHLIGANLDRANLDGANLDGANLDGASLIGARLIGARLIGARLDRANLDGAHLIGANLDRANLDGASLDGAHLDRANLLNVAGIYVAFAPHLSSRRAALLGGLVLRNNKIELRFWAGCQTEITAAELLKRVNKTHADNSLHAEQYKAAIEFIQKCFKADMKAGKWNYLLPTIENEESNG